jgi:hypothetical protein
MLFESVHIKLAVLHREEEALWSDLLSSLVDKSAHRLCKSSELDGRKEASNQGHAFQASRQGSHFGGMQQDSTARRCSDVGHIYRVTADNNARVVRRKVAGTALGQDSSVVHDDGQTVQDIYKDSDMNNVVGCNSKSSGCCCSCLQQAFDSRAGAGAEVQVDLSLIQLGSFFLVCLCICILAKSSLEYVKACVCVSVCVQWA